MPRQVVIQETCDLCADNGEETPAVITLVFAFNENRPWPTNKKPMEALLCDVHRKEVQGVMDTLARVARPWDEGTPVKKPTAPSGSGRAAEGARTSSGVSLVPQDGAPEGHMARPIPESKWPEGLPKPTVGPEGETVFQCTECTGDAQAEATFSTKDRKRPVQSLRLHMRQQHGWDV